MTAARLLLALVALAMVGFGAPYLIAPAEMAAVTEVGARTPTARSDVRAQYGGFQVGVGAFLFACLARRDRTALGLLAAALTLGGFTLAHVGSILADGPVKPVVLGALAVEAVGAVLCGVTWLIVDAGRTVNPPPTEDW